MKLKTKIILITIALALPALMLGRIIWPDAAMLEQPTSGEIPFYAFLAAVEAALFGGGMALLIFGMPRVLRVPKEQRRSTLLAFISLVWLLVSWWPHDNLHRHIGMDPLRLLYIEYGFHLTLIVASLFLVSFFWSSIKRELKGKE